MNTKLITTAVFAALFSASPVLHAQSLVGGATGNLQGAIGVGPGGLGGQDAIGRLGARDTVNGVQREVRGSLAERRAELAREAAYEIVDPDITLTKQPELRAELSMFLRPEDEEFLFKS